MKTENGVKRGTGLSKILTQKNLCIEREGKGSLTGENGRWRRHWTNFGSGVVRGRGSGDLEDKKKYKD